MSFDVKFFSFNNKINYLTKIRIENESILECDLDTKSVRKEKTR